MRRIKGTLEEILSISVMLGQIGAERGRPVKTRYIHELGADFMVIEIDDQEIEKLLSSRR